MELLKKALPFLQDVTDVNTSDMDLVEWLGETLMFYCAGQQYSDNVLTMAKSPMPLNKFLQSFF